MFLVNGDQGIAVSGDGAFHHDQTLFRVHLHNPQVAHLYTGVAVLPGQFRTLEDAGRLGALANGAGTAEGFVHSV